MNEIKIFYKRKLPHYQPPGYTFFITFRLYATMPKEIVDRYKLLKETQLKNLNNFENKKIRSEKYLAFKKNYFKLYDEYLDKASYGPKWLQDRKIADIVKKALHYNDGIKYNLIAYTIMPNHVHLVIEPIIEKFVGRTDCSTYIVTSILKSLKWYTARECNKILNRSGAFWQHESYDHVVRNSESLIRIVKYVLNNPVKAGLVSDTEEYMFNYVNEKLIN